MHLNEARTLSAAANGLLCAWAADDAAADSNLALYRAYVSRKSTASLAQETVLDYKVHTPISVINTWSTGTDSLSKHLGLKKFV